MKRTIRLKESELRRMISESVNRILNEKKYPNPMGGPESRINAYPEYAKDFNDGSVDIEDDVCVMPIPNKERLHTLDRTTDAFADWETGDHAYYADGDVYPSAEWSSTDFYGRPSHYSQWAKDADEDLEKLQTQRFKDDLDRQWQNTKDMEKISKRADSGPLHRKGSLNRADLDENRIRKIVSQTMKNVINKKGYL